MNLEPEDDHISVRDKLSWAKASKVVLLWPRHGRPLPRQLDLAIVQRHAQRRGLEIGLVNYDPEILTNAERLGIPIFESVDQLPSGDWGSRPPQAVEPARRDRPSLSDLRQARAASVDPLISLGDRGRIGVFVGAVVSVVAIAVAVLPRAEVVIDPNQLPIERRIAITIDPQSFNPAGTIPGQRVAVQVSGSQRIDSSGRVRLPDSVASGEVEFTNLTDERISIPAGIGLRAGAVRFLTTETVEVDARGSVTAAVVAAEAGRSGNVGATTIEAVEGPLGFAVSVLNLEPSRGGGDTLAESVSEADRDRLREELLADLLRIAEGDLEAQLPLGDKIVPGSLSISEVVVEEYDARVGEAADTIALSMTLEVEALSYSESQALAEAENLLQASLSGGRLIIPESLSLELFEVSDDRPTTVVTFLADAQLGRSVDFDRVRQSAAGVPTTLVAQRLAEKFGLSRAPEVRTWPSWSPWLPWLGMRIDVKWAWDTG